MLNFEYTFVIQRDLSYFKNTLNSKIEGFDEFDKNYSGYYYLMDLIKIIPTLKFKNDKDFYANLTYIVQEFPVKNNEKIGYGNYFGHFNEFKDYINTEFGLLPKNRIFWRRFWIWWVLFFITISIITALPLIGLVVGLVLAIISANNSENKRRKKGLVLGLKKQSQ